MIRTYTSQTDFVIRLLLRLIYQLHTCRAFTARKAPQLYDLGGLETERDIGMQAY
jgi:hypothetical protein